jgi:tetratricopeptide (TPR) repeat protein
MKETLPSVAAQRRLEPRRLNTLVRGELDWIVMKALEKDRARRYETANGLAGDVLRYLANEPVNAGAPSRAYRVRKFARRHKVGIGVSAAMLLLLLAGLAGTTFGLVRARRERDNAVAARNAAEAARKAEAEAREYEKQTDKFLTDMFTSIDPEQSRGRPVLVKELLDQAAARIDAQPPSHNIVEASLRYTFGNAYIGLGLLEPARAQLERGVALYRAAYGPKSPSLMRALNQLGQVYKQQGRRDDAESSYRKSLEMHRELLGPDNSDTLSVQGNLGFQLMLNDKLSEAESLLADAAERMKRAGGDANDRAELLNNLANLRQAQGRYAEAEATYREALADVTARMGEDHPFTLGLTNNLGSLLRTQGKFDEAIATQRKALELARKVFGPDHPDTLTLGNNFGLMLTEAGRYDEAHDVYLDTLDRRRRTLGEEHPATLLIRSNYGLLLQSMGRLDEAETIFRDVVEHMKRANGENHRDTLIALNNLGWLRFLRGDAAGAEAIFRDLVPRARASFGAQNPVTVSFLLRHGQTLSMQDRWRDAEPLLAEAYRGAQAIGADKQGGYAAGYGICLAHLNKPQEALPVLTRADEMLRHAPVPDTSTNLRLAEAMVMVHEQLGDAAKAQVWRERREALARQQQQQQQPGTTQPATMPAGAAAPATMPATQP